MKGVMYHYVREACVSLPYFTYLHIASFERQLDYFAAHHHVANQAEFEQAIITGKPLHNAVVLTFDDGLADHDQYVRPALVKRGLWGIFYVPTQPYTDAKLLDVHRIHYLLGRLGGQQLLAMLTPKIHDDMILQERRALLATHTYQKQHNPQAVTAVKRLVNYFLKPEYKEAVLGAVMREVVGDEAALAQRFYLTRAQINSLIDDGLAVGCHAHSHTLLSHLSDDEQSREVAQSTAALQTFTGGRLFPSFCFPYGGKPSYTAQTLRLLPQHGYTSGFSVESRDISHHDLHHAPYELPRYDCNEFPHGSAVLGEPA